MPVVEKWWCSDFNDFRGWSGNETNHRASHLSYKKNVINECGIHVDPSSLLAMSWLWDKLYGGGSGSGSGDFLPPMEGGGEGKDQTPQVQGEGKKWTGFDPTGLERAAKAARELDQSRKYW